MIQYNYKFRVGYADTDQMGSMHHVNYVKYCECARWELLRNIWIPYKSIDDDGVMCPVVSMQFKFIKQATYDSLITIKTTFQWIKGVRMFFEYDFLNESDEIINHAETLLAFVRKNDWKPCRPPVQLLEVIENLQQK